MWIENVSVTVKRAYRARVLISHLRSLYVLKKSEAEGGRRVNVGDLDIYAHTWALLHVQWIEEEV